MCAPVTGSLHRYRGEHTVAEGAADLQRSPLEELACGPGRVRSSADLAVLARRTGSIDRAWAARLLIFDEACLLSHSSKYNQRSVPWGRP